MDRILTSEHVFPVSSLDDTRVGYYREGTSVEVIILLNGGKNGKWEM